MWCHMHCVGAECGHMAFCLPLLDGTVRKKFNNYGGMALEKRGLFCIRLYTILIQLYGLYTVYIQYRGLLYSPFPQPYAYALGTDDSSMSTFNILSRFPAQEFT
jgi:hypothetical protein